MKKAYLYDFDNTICAGDSGSAFWLFCLVRKPWLIVFLPVQIIGGVCYKLGIFRNIQRKFSLYCFLRAIDSEKMAEKFWNRRQRKIYPFFYERKRDMPTVVCTASPEFLIKPVCDRLGVEKVIATKVNADTGKIMSKPCKQYEKVKRLGEELPGCEFPEVYSDSLKNDIHILKLGKRAFHTVHGKVSEIRLDI
jgi:phosphatidylglycerophosphatase C